MANKTKKQTKEETKAKNEIKIPEQYDYDRFKGRNFLKTLPEILNKRYGEGWRFLKIFNLGEDTSRIPIKTVYGILYEKLPELLQCDGVIGSIETIPAENETKPGKNETDQKKKTPKTAEK